MVQPPVKVALQIVFTGRLPWVLMRAVENDESLPIGRSMWDWGFCLVLCLRKLKPGVFCFKIYFFKRALASWCAKQQFSKCKLDVNFTNLHVSIRDKLLLVQCCCSSREVRRWSGESSLDPPCWAEGCAPENTCSPPGLVLEPASVPPWCFARRGHIKAWQSWAGVWKWCYFSMVVPNLVSMFLNRTGNWGRDHKRSTRCLKVCQACLTVTNVGRST